MTLSRFLTLFAAIIGTAAFLQAEQPKVDNTQNMQPMFKEHRIGESAQEFFSIAKMAEKNGMLSTDYCSSYLNDPKVKKAIEKAKKKNAAGSSFWGGSSVSAATMDVEGCNSIQAALAGQDVEVEARYATEFGSGITRFVAGHLASVIFVAKAPFNDVVEDMIAKLNVKPQRDVHTYQNSVGAIVDQRRAMWTLPSTRVKVSELQSVDGESIGTEVSVSDPVMMKHRANSLN